MPTALPLKKMTVNEKLMAMEALWTDLSANETKIKSPSWHGKVLRETQKLVKAGKAKFIDWDVAKASLREKISKI